MIPVFRSALGLASSEALLLLNTTAAFLKQRTVISNFSLNFATESACGFAVSPVIERKTHCSPEISSHEKQFNSSYSMDCFSFIQVERNKLGAVFDGF